ncbi:MAG: triose-phosphate isomerase [Bauldia sp.]
MARARPLVAGNWKMNGLLASVAELQSLRDTWRGTAEVAVCVPATLLTAARDILRGSAIGLGGQDCHPKASGAHTGDISAEMLADAGARLVIVGHSERRADHAESDELVRRKAEAAWRAGLTAILCIGETESERRAGKALEVATRQLAGSVPDGSMSANLVIAYEPVWAIGTGLTPTPDDIVEMHTHIRLRLVARFGAQAEGIGILYGGSVKPDNARTLLTLPSVDGALVGGASLKAKDFLAIAAAVG